MNFFDNTFTPSLNIVYFWKGGKSAEWKTMKSNSRVVFFLCLLWCWVRGGEINYRLIIRWFVRNNDALFAIPIFIHFACEFSIRRCEEAPLRVEGEDFAGMSSPRRSPFVIMLCGEKQLSGWTFAGRRGACNAMWALCVNWKCAVGREIDSMLNYARKVGF